jgi:mRNA interferase MazF
MNHVLVAPLTTTVRGIPTEVVLEPGDDPVGRVSAVNLDAVGELPKSHLTDYLGRLDHLRMREICDALRIAVDCD